MYVQNRSNCGDSWLPDLEDQINDKNTSSSDNSDLLEDKLNQTDNGVTSDTLANLPDALGNIIGKLDLYFKRRF